jgi:transposase
MPARCAGVDVPKKTVVACVLMPDGQGGWCQEPRTFGTMTAALLALAAWRRACGCTQVAIERTGDDWKPGCNLLEGTCEGLLVNAQHVKAGPGRQTAVKDAAWRAELLPHGWWCASCIPRWPSANGAT